MIFELEDSCFLQVPKTLELLQLANLVLQGRHRVYIKNQSNLDYLKWVGTLPAELSDIWKLSLDLSMEYEALEPACLTVKVCESSAPCRSLVSPVLDVRQASRFAVEPYRVFVENDGADRDFLLTFSDQNQKKKIEELESHQLIRFEHCGGIGELKKRVARFGEADPLYPAICAAVFDSDAPQPSDFSKDALAVQSVCDANGVAAFMLKRRSIENYLLRSWLNSWINQSRERRSRYLEIYNSFCQLNQMQRAHFHMKRGLSTDSEKITDGTVVLYNDVSANQRKHLMQGFGNDVGSELYAAEWVQNSVPTDDPDAWAEVNAIVKDFLVLCR